MTQALTKEWYNELEEQSAKSFINLPIEFQLKGYSYSKISDTYLKFFNSNDNTRKDKLILAKKFLTFIRKINKNRAKHELGESFFECFDYFMNNFADLIEKPDFIHLEALTVMADALDKSQFIEDVISVDELKNRVKRIQQIDEKEEAINADWTTFEGEYRLLNCRNIKTGIPQRPANKTELRGKHSAKTKG